MPTRPKSKPAFSRLTRLGGPQAGTVAALVLGRAGSSLTVFVGTQVGVFRSVGFEGKTLEGWERLPTAPIGVVSVAVSPGYAEDHTIVVGTNTGIVLSKNFGETWWPAQMPISGSIVTTICFSPNYGADGILLAGTLEDGILYSDTRGERWHNKSFGLLDATVYSLAFSPNFAQDGIVYASTDTAVYYSYNRALAWKQLSFPDGATPALSLTLSPNFQDDHTLYVGTEKQGLYRSADRGASWQKLDLPAACVNALLVSPTNHALIAATEAGIFLSSDQGGTWRCLLDHANVISLISGEDMLIAGLVDEGLRMTTDLVVWQAIPNLFARSLLGLVLSPHFDRDPIAYMFGPQEGIWRTEDGGRAWDCLNDGLPSPDISALVVSPEFSKDHTLLAASPAGVLISRDAGSHWTRAAEEPAGLVSFSPDGKLLAAGFLESGIRASEDFGKTWLRAPGPWESGKKVAALSVNNSHHYYVAVLEGVGETVSLWQGTPGQFEKVLSQPAGNNPVISLHIPPEPAPDRPWYVSLGNRVWKFSSRKGRPAAQSTVFSDEGQRQSILSLTGIQSQTGQILLASTGQHVFKSNDAKTWTRVYDFGNERAVSLALSPSYSKDKTVYVLLLGGKFGQVVIR